jgi:hypothetical protein
MGPRHLTVVGLLASLLTVGLITGCAQGTGTPSAGGSSSVSSEPSASASDSAGPGSPTPSRPTRPTPPPTSDGAGTTAGPDMTISGQVEAGVEANCLVMNSGGRLYLLLGGDRNVIKAGNNVEARGHVVKGIMSYCMQGQPFQVTEAHLK